MRAAASAGFVDQTSEDVVGERGRNAMGPVGRNRWNAVVLGFWKSVRVRGAWERVATMAWVSYDHPNDEMLA